MRKSPSCCSSLRVLSRLGPRLRIKGSSREVILDLFKKIRMQPSKFSRKYDRVLFTGQAFLHQLDPRFYQDQNLMLPQILLNGIAGYLKWIVWLLQLMLACVMLPTDGEVKEVKLRVFTATECCVVFKVLNTMSMKLLMLLHKASYETSLVITCACPSAYIRAKTH